MFGPGGPIALILSNAPPTTTPFLVVGLSAVNLPLKGGILVPAVDLLLSLSPTSGTGGLVFNSPLGPLPSGFSLVFQYWLPDAGGPAGFVASQGVCATAP